MAEQPQTPDNRRFTMGKYASIFWLLAWVSIVACSWNEAKDMQLHEWGDFFAGIVGPIALLWLVLGYLQQGEELRINTEALKAQEEELRNQVEETRKLAAQHKSHVQIGAESLALSRQQYRDELNLSNKSLRPRFQYVTCGKDHTWYLKLRNLGHGIYNVSVSHSISKVRVEMPQRQSWGKGRSGQIDFKRGENDLALPIEFVLKYENEPGEHQETLIRWNDGGKIETIDDDKSGFDLIIE